MGPSNFLILHQGMGWPVGSVVPPEAFPHGVTGHLRLGAVKPTDAPPTVGGALPPAPKPGDDLAKVNGELRTEVANLCGMVEGLKTENAELREKLAKLSEENATLWTEVEAQTAAREARAAAEVQATLDAGPAAAAAK